jgi:tRNA (cytidine/uridine-2'-O-)-methyltransferase
MSDPYEPLLHVVLFQPEIPYNTGSVGRTCVAIGAKLWLVRPLGFRVDDYYLRRAGLDYWQYLAWEVVDDWAALTQQLDESRCWFFTKRGSSDYRTVAYNQGDVFVFGRESSGLPTEITSPHPERLLRIPTRPQVRSLNLSNSVAIATYEALRQIES